MSSESPAYLVTMLGGALVGSAALGIALTWGIARLVRRDLRAWWGALGLALLVLAAVMWARAWTFFLVVALVLGLGIGCLVQALRRPRGRNARIV